MRLLTYSETLVYYDGPQLFIGLDQLGLQHVCLLVEQNEKIDSFLCVPVSKHRADGLRLSDIDLRDIFISPETNELFVGESSAWDLQKIPIHPIAPEDIPEAWFPDPGFKLGLELDHDIEVVHEAVERNRAVIHCTLQPPEARDGPKITVEHLGQSIKLIQRLVKHAYLRALRDKDARTRAAAKSESNYQLQVFAFSPGSFTIHMQTTGFADLVGFAQISQAFSIIDEVTQNLDDPQSVVERVAKYSGHFATAYKELLKFISQSDIPIGYEWSMPELRKSTKRWISITHAKPLYEAIIQHLDLGVEEVKLIGRLSKVDSTYRKWRLVSDDDQREFSGEVDPESNVDLAGLVIESERYEFTCEERLFEEVGTGRETTKLFLISHRPL